MPFKKGNVPWNKGKRYSMKHSGQFKAGYAPWNKGTKGKMAKTKPDSFKEYRRKAWTGADNPNWRGGTSAKEKVIKNSSSWRRWRRQVFKRDNYTCQQCGERGGKIHPHHIKPFSKYPKLRFEVSNGVTLCRECHHQTDNYGSKCNA